MKFHLLSKLNRIVSRVNEEKFHYFLDNFHNYRRKWSFSGKEVSGEISGTTSLSDYSLYGNFCELASQDEHVFSKFRSCTEYQEILEHVTRKLGKSYLDIIQQSGASISKIKETTSDDIGKPFKFNYPGIGRLSPTQLRYYKVLIELENLFGKMESWKVVEVGIGYGGQASQICREHKITNYLLIDLPPVLKLSKRYLDIRAPKSPITYGHDSKEMVHEVDLFISNYAFSELRRDVQDDYFEKFIRNSRRGYVTYNHITPKEWGSYSAVEFSNKINGSEVIAEEPNSFEGNVIVVWGHR